MFKFFASTNKTTIPEVFANHSYEKLISTGVGKVVICENPNHFSKKIDIISLIVKSFSFYL